MKHYWLIILFAIGIISFTGCYTQLATHNDESEVYDEPIIYQPPEPVCTLWVPVPIPPPTSPIRPPFYPPKDRPSNDLVYKTRNPQIDRSGDSKDRGSIRNTGGRNSSVGRGGRR
ncbi:MAG: hypothetical protein JSW63_01805 [Ignavibacterium sp.]|nr:MAG: hypothetical protein JSW63_01805 [Ignavibacterium sp.]